MGSTKVDKWIWMMDWCKAQGLPPADARIWSLAERAYITNTEKKGV